MSTSNPSVLVVDDEDELAELYSKFLEVSGFNCMYFTDPHAAIDDFAKNFNSYSLVITDLRMPGLDGLELTRRLRIYNKTVKILLITGFLVEENLDQDLVKEVGVSAVLEKPIHFKDLKPMIKQTLTS
ncbi:response regulator [Candidatus Nitrosocosmicus sp. T]